MARDKPHVMAWDSGVEMRQGRRGDCVTEMSTVSSLCLKEVHLENRLCWGLHRCNEHKGATWLRRARVKIGSCFVFVSVFCLLVCFVFPSWNLSCLKLEKLRQDPGVAGVSSQTYKMNHIWLAGRKYRYRNIVTSYNSGWHLNNSITCPHKSHIGHQNQNQSVFPCWILSQLTFERSAAEQVWKQQD